MKKIIGLTGFAKSGKSTASEVLKEHGGQEIAFAKHLKDVCSLVFNVPRENFDDQKVKEVPFGFDLYIMTKDILTILNYFEVPARFIPETVVKHRDVKLTSPRHMAQYVGTEILRSIDSDIHINMAFKLNEKSSAPFLICSDVRFNNELEAVHSKDGLMLGIYRKSVVPSVLDNLHPSEKEIPSLIEKADAVINNETTLHNFKEKVLQYSLKFLASQDT